MEDDDDGHFQSSCFLIPKLIYSLQMKQATELTFQY